MVPAYGVPRNKGAFKDVKTVEDLQRVLDEHPDDPDVKSLKPLLQKTLPPLPKV